MTMTPEEWTKAWQQNAALIRDMVKHAYADGIRAQQNEEPAPGSRGTELRGGLMRVFGWDGAQFDKAAKYLEICTGEDLDGWKAFEDALFKHEHGSAKRIWTNWVSRRLDQPGEIKIIVECR